MNEFEEYIFRNLHGLDDARELVPLFPEISQRNFLRVENGQVKLFNETIYQKTFDAHDDDEGNVFFSTAEGEIKNGSMEGLWIETGKYVNRIYYSGGIFEGLFQRLSKEGIVLAEGNMEGGVPVGLWKYYGERGNLIYEAYST